MPATQRPSTSPITNNEEVAGVLLLFPGTLRNPSSFHNAETEIQIFHDTLDRY
jgi:hypothetical protein